MNDPDPDDWFPEKATRSRGQRAQRVCMGCPVRRECNQYANDTGAKDGIWGAQWF